MTGIAKAVFAAVIACAAAAGAEPVHRFVPEAPAAQSDLTTSTCRYKPVFDVSGRLRFGEMVVEPHGRSAVVSHPGEEGVYVVAEGAGTLLYGDEKHPVRKDDFLYLPPGVRHGVANESAAPVRVFVMEFRVPESPGTAGPLMIANINDVPKQTVASHPPSTQYRLLMGDVTSKRDRLAAARVVTSLFVMEFAPGGTNIPHQHKTEDEIYLVIGGHGEMVAGDARHPARAGDAWYFPPDTKVGFYAPKDESARILAVRSRVP